MKKRNEKIEFKYLIIYLISVLEIPLGMITGDLICIEFPRIAELIYYLFSVVGTVMGIIGGAYAIYSFIKTR